MAVLACAALLAVSACSKAKRWEDETPPSPATIAAPPVKTATVAEAPPPITSPEGKPLARVKVSVESSLEAAMVGALGKELGTPLSQVTNRVLIWLLDTRDLRKGDEIEVVYETRDLEEPLAHAVWLRADKLGRTVGVVRYQPAGSSYARYYLEDGQELELRLEDAPLESYEQVTSLLNDGRRHKGVDFKTPVGTAVHATFDGVVVQRNWGRANGNCLELADSKSGRHAKFLHLEQIAAGIGVGTRVKKGQEIAKSGNTGRSFAPHLHYQMEQGTRILDPFKVHKTYRAKLPGDEAAKAKGMLDGYARLRMGAT